MEACGNGSGFLHHEEEPELAHFRAHFTLASWKTPLGWLQPRVSAGFAELQLEADGSGYHFEDTGPSGLETVGPEVGASLRALLPVSAGFELVGSWAWGPRTSTTRPGCSSPRPRSNPPPPSRQASGSEPSG